jgi:tetratricopeptide (TPR) repeat protein
LALHLTIHAWEASPHPERAVAAANRLRFLQPSLGHMVHMPSHIDVRTGRWKEAIASNERAIRADLTFRKVRPAFDPYLFYTAHNYHMLGFSAMMSGQRKKALAAMDALVELVPSAMQKDLAPFIDGMYAMPFEARIRFGLWDEILAQGELPSYFPLANALRHAARGVAFAAKGDSFSADAEALEFANAQAAIPRDEKYDHTPNGVILDVAGSLLAGEILLAKGRTEDAIVELRKAAESEKKVRYSEPPDWVLPTRHVLGVALLKAKRPGEAEQVYRESLRQLPNDGWALQGLDDALVAQNKMSEAMTARRRFAQAWADADTKIGSSCLCVPKP